MTVTGAEGESPVPLSEPLSPRRPGPFAHSLDVVPNHAVPAKLETLRGAGSPAAAPPVAQGASRREVTSVAAAAIGPAAQLARGESVAQVAASQKDGGRIGSHTASKGGVAARLKSFSVVKWIIGRASTEPLETDVTVSFSPPPPKLEERDAALGLSETRSVTPFTEQFAVGEKTATMTLSVVKTRDEQQKTVEHDKSRCRQRLTAIEAQRRTVPHDAGLAHQQQVVEWELEECERELKTLNRDSEAVHATFSREVLPGHLRDRSVVEPPDLAVRTLEIGNTETSSVQVGALGDQKNTKTSLRQLSRVVEWRAKKEEYIRQRRSLTLQKGRLKSAVLETEGRLAPLRQRLDQLKSQQASGGDRYVDADIRRLEANVGQVSELLALQEAALKDTATRLENVESLEEAEKEMQQTLEDLRQEKGEIAERLQTLKAETSEHKKLTSRLDSLNYMIEELENPERTLVMRRGMLTRQLLPVLRLQTQRAAAQGRISPGGRIDVAHLSLLHPEKDFWDAMSQLAHDEGCLIEDMEQLYAEVDGKAIQFDGSEDPSFVDEQGVIHLPAPERIEVGTQVTLHTHYANIVVQATGSMKEDSVRKMGTLNDRVFTEITKGLATEISALQQKQDRSDDENVRLQRLRANQKRMETVEKKVKAGGVSYEYASVIDEACALLGWLTQKGCFSAKDRGGYTGRKAILDQAVHDREARVQLNPQSTDVSTFEGEARDLRGQVAGAFEANSVEMQLVRWTTLIKQKTLKVWPGRRDFPSVIKIFSHLKRFVGDRRAVV